MWAVPAVLRNTYPEKTLLTLSDAECRKKKASESWDSAKVRGWTLKKVTSVSQSLLRHWGKHVKGWRARVLSGHAVRGMSVRELLWTSLSVLGRSAITGQISERRALEVKRNLWQMLWDDSPFKNNRRGSHMVPRNRIWAHNSLQQSVLS